MPAYASNRAVMDEGLTIFLGAMAPYVIREIETLADKPIEVAANEIFGQEVGTRFVEDLSNYESGVSGRGRALTRITLTVEFCWPIFKRRLRNKKVAVGALRQIEFSGVSAADENSGLEQLFVEQRFEEMEDILNRIDADEALGTIEALKDEIRP